jgi:ATP-dependent Lon protease
VKIHHNAEDIEIRSTLPIIPLRDVVIYPHMIYPLLIGRKLTINALQEAMVQEKQMFLVAQRSPSVDNPKAADLYTVGVVARILQVMKMPNGTLKVLVEGLIRAEIISISKTNSYLSAKLNIIKSPESPFDRETEALSRAVSEQFAEYVRLNRRIPDEVLVSVASIDQYDQMADTIAAQIIQKVDAKQRLLESFDIKEQLRLLSKVLRDEIDILKIEQKIDGSIRDSLNRSHREAYLQQQLKAIKDELGQGEDATAEVDDLLNKLDSQPFPEKVRLKAEEEIKKLSKMHPFSAEAGVVRSYLDWLLGIPWTITTEDRTDFNEVRTILDNDHYGLDKPKRRILEHLAVIRLAGKVKGPILCLVGPPGVGKTSIGRSVARAMGRAFVRMSLGGVHDEAEIRGHRRTYIGALPGRIIQSLKKAGSGNPVFLLDEIDKLGKDFRGDPASALLEVLDPEQNNTFYDNYLEVEFDLSNILFITTANSIGSIPLALRDRMEIIRLPGYLDFEKAAIAKQYLVPKQMKEVGVQKYGIEFSEDAIFELIRYYTREAGVRELERRISAILRQSAVEIAGGKKVKKLMIKGNKVGGYLGARKYTETDVKQHPTIGYAVGLAWTELGGEVLPVEVVPMHGKAKLTLTGSLGEVMRESATAGLSYIRKHAQSFGLNDNFFDELELHVHVPEGAVPKDGPSAGITLLTALLSSLTNIPVRTDIAMTGEVTLTGDVLPIGGLNEKLLAAKRHGIMEVVLPERNRKDLTEMPKELLEDLKLHFVRHIDEVLKLVMTRSPYIVTRTRATKPHGARVSRTV